MKRDWSAAKLSSSPQAARLRAVYGVEPTLSARDFIFNTLVHANDGDVEAAYEQYLSGGSNDARQLAEVVAEVPPNGATARALSLLDFAAGYGRVTRHFGVVAPEWTIAAADIHWRAKRFNERELGIPTYLSSYFPRLLRVPRESFDVVFCLSFFSHVRDRQFAPWLRAVLRLLRPGGVLVATTHGEASRAIIDGMPLSEDGYGMIATSEQFDLPRLFYVHACTTKAYVERRVAETGLARIELFRPAAWFGHQDLYVIRRIGN